MTFKISLNLTNVPRNLGDVRNLFWKLACSRNPNDSSMMKIRSLHVFGEFQNKTLSAVKNEFKMNDWQRNSNLSFKLPITVSPHTDSDREGWKKNKKLKLYGFSPVVLYLITENVLNRHLQQGNRLPKQFNHLYFWIPSISYSWNTRKSTQNKNLFSPSILESHFLHISKKLSSLLSI